MKNILLLVFITFIANFYGIENAFASKLKKDQCLLVGGKTVDALAMKHRNALEAITLYEMIESGDFELSYRISIGNLSGISVEGVEFREFRSDGTCALNVLDDQGRYAGFVHVEFRNAPWVKRFGIGSDR